MLRRADPEIGPGSPDTVAIDPFADLLFALIAAVLPMILLLVATARPPTPRSPPAPASAAAETGPPPLAVVAGRDGLRWAGHSPIGPDAIPDSLALRQRLVDAKAAGTPLVEVIEPDGLESAFLLEPVAAAAGTGALRQIRLTSPCAEAPDPALRRLCDTAGPDPVAR